MTLLDEVMLANAAHLAGEPVPRPPLLGDKRVLVLTCADPRLTVLLPAAMGVAVEEMMQIRNTGNRAETDSGESVRSICGCIVLGVAAEVFVIGHTDCLMRRFTASQILDGMKAGGISRDTLGHADIREAYGGIASERTNALDSARAVRKSRLLPPGTPVHALIVHSDTGKLENLEDGYGPAAIMKAGSPGATEEFAVLDSPEDPLETRPVADEATPVLRPVEPEKARSRPAAPPPPPPRPPPRKSAPVERAEDVLKRLTKRRRR